MTTTHDAAHAPRGAGLHWGRQPVTWHRVSRITVVAHYSAAAPLPTSAEAGTETLLQLHDPHEASIAAEGPGIEEPV